jgi:hypothetical protein
METVFKLAISALVMCAIYYELLLIRTVWRSQIDPQVTVSRVLAKLKPDADVIATRDPAKIYQGGVPVGDVTGEISRDGSKWTFKQISNTTRLQTDQPFEYQRNRLRIVGIGSRTGMLVNMTDSGTQQATDVLGDVVCDIVQR